MTKSQEHPVTAPQAVTTERLGDDIGLLRVAMFPGAIGIDVVKDINPGIAAPRRMQSARRRATQQDWRRIGGALDELFDTPKNSRFAIWLAARYAFVEKSIL
jgi:hypothetical protein